MMTASIIQTMIDALPAGLTLLAISAAFALVLLIASIKLRVVEDPQVVAIREVLPGVDCGACGFAGCGAYAKAVKENPELIGKCAPGGQGVCEAIAAVLNIQASGTGAPKRPIVQCRAHKDEKVYFGEYNGIASCTSANALPNNQACRYGCLGFGDCVAACQFDALSIRDGLATVNYDNCTGCTACVKECPRGIIRMVPFTEDTITIVGCSSKESGKDTRSMCKVGCIGCKMCTRQTDQFHMEGNMARLDYDNFQHCEEIDTAVEKCPTGAIVYRGKNAKPDRPAGTKPKPKPKPQASEAQPPA